MMKISRGSSMGAWPRLGAATVAVLAAVVLPISVAAQPAAGDDTAESAYQKGRLAYSRGDIMGAMSWYTKAGSDGHARAQVGMGLILDGANQDDEAVRWYRKAAEQNDPEGMYLLGDMYLKGEGVTQDFAEGMTWIKRSAEAGDGNALMVYATSLERGHFGLSTDVDEARRWFEQGAANGNKAAMSRLARAYQNGELGLPVDAVLAQQWRDRAGQSAR